MLTAFLILAAAQVPPTPPTAAPTEEPIVITANRLDRVRFNLSLNRLTGEMKCTIARSSGRAEIDRYMCDVARYCARTSRKTRAAIEQCITERKQAYLARMPERGR